MSLQDLQQNEGQELAVTEWFEVDQQRVNLFADATDDHQWIHIDQERCAAESPYGGTIAHGFLSLSLVPKMLEDSIQISPARLVLNYGLNKVRFPAPVRVGSRVRGALALHKYEEIEGGAQILWTVMVEVEGQDKPACFAELITRVYQ